MVFGVLTVSVQVVSFRLGFSFLGCGFFVVLEFVWLLLDSRKAMKSTRK